MRSYASPSSKIDRRLWEGIWFNVLGLGLAFLLFYGVCYYGVIGPAEATNLSSALSGGRASHGLRSCFNVTLRRGCTRSLVESDLPRRVRCARGAGRRSAVDGRCGAS